MKQIFLSIVAVAVSLNLLAQKTFSDANAEKRQVASFHGIDVGTGIKLVISEGATEELAVSASKPEFREKIVTEVVDGILKIHYDSRIGAINRSKESKHLRAYVSYKALDKLMVNTGAEVEINGVLKASSLDLYGNTGGLVKGEVDVERLKVDQNTGSKFTLTGKVGALDVDGDTGSKFFGEGLTCTNCSASVNTGAQVYITVNKELNAKANTGGYIRYKGDGSIRDVKVNTGGSVAKI